ncbi:Pimeloyl-ACP methyl ester carboxylesterase [Aquiflexum balticum DSM 16537]|uniref:Pimeloyl-ACP methyl ester carboxylesterase n=1 Tax=Aquiflexum balticum DSM 16537 TaxID=758820 RepID=A0A1W2GZF9_9BACT|nr:alpha/beta hydrolase [Aquiflexum balticum]SMD42033.1 Pimeloyl-ACP methyl ester carboxylesterase [Aquiflexum balticum DSM 16537]
MIAFSQKGTGQALILIHGFCESKEMWKTFSDHLSKSYQVFCPDLPGFGESPLDQTQISLEETAVLLQEWMEENHIHHPFIIGHSLGGYVTLALAELMGQELKAIGLFHSTAFADDEEKKKTRNKTIDFVKKNGVDKFIDSFVPPLFSEQHRASQSEKIEELISFGKRSSKQGILAFIAAMRDRKDRFDVWKTFQGPKLMIAGDLDPAVKVESSRLHQPFGTLYHEMIGVGHMGMFEQQEEALRTIEKFLSDRSG